MYSTGRLHSAPEESVDLHHVWEPGVHVAPAVPCPLNMGHRAATLSAQRSKMWNFRKTAGPVCTLHLPHHIPPGLHGSWSSGVRLAAPAETPKVWQPTFTTIPH